MRQAKAEEPIEDRTKAGDGTECKEGHHGRMGIPVGWKYSIETLWVDRVRRQVKLSSELPSCTRREMFASRLNAAGNQSLGYR